tara:strand:+ start:3784 stop:4524 length:741 start_codon:yes stop_codon:yes gene_type:complete
MAKLDKSKYTKQEWRLIREKRRQEKHFPKLAVPQIAVPVNIERLAINTSAAFVLGNGTSRSPINVFELAKHGKTYGCNALYRTFSPDYLIAVDVKMILEINKSGYQHHNVVWTNPNKSYQSMRNLNYFQPSKGWSSGPTALWLASQHGYDKIFILGFDYKGLGDGKKLNNIYADTVNYKKSTEGATFFGNWLRQTKNVIEQHPNINYFRVIASDNYLPDELNKFNNLTTITVDKFMKMHSISTEVL